jgi:hypothetical protein
LHLLQPGLGEGGQLVDAAGSEVGQAFLQMRPHALVRVEVWCVGGEREDGQPVAGIEEFAHRRVGVPRGVVPHEHNRPAELLVGGIQQAGEIVFPESLLLALAAVVGDRPVEQPGSCAGLGAEQRGDRDPA